MYKYVVILWLYIALLTDYKQGWFVFNQLSCFFFHKIKINLFFVEIMKLLFSIIANYYYFTFEVVLPEVAVVRYM